MMQVTTGVNCFIQTYSTLFMGTPGAFALVANTVKKRISGEIPNFSGIVLAEDRESLDAFASALTKYANIDGVSFSLCEPIVTDDMQLVQYVSIVCDDEECMSILNMTWG